MAHFGILGCVAYLILLERKIASWVQDRIGPNRVGLGFGIVPGLKDMHMFGLGQPLADGLKFILKEDYRPAGTDKNLFTIAPALMVLVVIISIAVLPWGGVKQSTVTVDVTGNSDVNAAVKDQIPWMVKVVDQKVETREERVGADYVIKQYATVVYQYPFQIADLNIGVLFVLAALSLAVYGVVVGGWASNNKYSFLGGLRATANMISYEVPLGLTIITIAMMFGSLSLNDIVEKQAHYWAGFIPAWNVFCQPVPFFLFLVCLHAEANRLPFDTAEAEQELVGGYHTEYSSMRFALFFLGEYAGMVTTSAVCVALFFGGWHLPWLEWAWPALAGNVDPNHPALTTSIIACVVRSLVFFGKTMVIIAIFMWVRWSLPRFRFDQILNLAWRALIPVTTFLMVATAITMWALGPTYLGSQMRVGGRMALILLIMNAVVTAAVMVGSFIVPAAPPTNRKMVLRERRVPASPVPTTA
ncbi:MAG TPA: complex I subunit 1 family protein [Tepidisphaeraceae bacterium]